MVTRCSESIALWKRLMKPNLNALYFQEVTLPIQGVHKVGEHFKKFITLFLFVIEIICKNI